MNDNTFDETARALTSRDELNGTCEINGDELPIRVAEPTIGELEAIEEEVGADGDETDAIREMVSRYLVAPEVSADDIGVSKLYALFDAMNATWQQGEVFDEAEEAMPVEQGNSPNSRR
jgi:hypothetical protein